MVGHNRPIAPHLPQPFSTLQPHAVFVVASREHPKFSHMPFQHRQNLETSSQSFQVVVANSIVAATEILGYQTTGIVINKIRELFRTFFLSS